MGRLSLFVRKLLMGLFLLLLSLCVYSCSSSPQTHREEVEFLHLKLPDDLLQTRQEIKLSDIADSVWYVPLETTMESLLGDLAKRNVVHFVNQQFYICDNHRNTVYRFSSDGKFLNRIGRKGQGQKEFLQFLDFVVDGEYLYMADFGNRIHKYHIDGTYVDKITLPKQSYRLMSLGGDTLACYITDDQFSGNVDRYTWLMVNGQGDSLTCGKRVR